LIFLFFANKDFIEKQVLNCILSGKGNPDSFNLGRSFLILCKGVKMFKHFDGESGDHQLNTKSLEISLMKSAIFVLKKADKLESFLVSNVFEAITDLWLAKPITFLLSIEDTQSFLTK